MELNQYMDHTLLKQNATQEQLAKLCDEAARGRRLRRSG